MLSFKNPGISLDAVVDGAGYALIPSLISHGQSDFSAPNLRKIKDVLATPIGDTTPTHGITHV